MNIGVRQIYIRPGVKFPFSHHFQTWVAAELAALVSPSDVFIRDFGRDFTIVFNLSAKDGIDQLEIKGPTCFKRTKDVEYTIFLPFDVISASTDRIAGAVRCFLAGVVSVLESLGIDACGVSKQIESIVRHVCSDRSMIKGT